MAKIVGGKQSECGCIVRFVHGRLQTIRCVKHLEIERDKIFPSPSDRKGNLK